MVIEEHKWNGLLGAKRVLSFRHTPNSLMFSLCPRKLLCSFEVKEDAKKFFCSYTVELFSQHEEQIPNIWKG